MSSYAYTTHHHGLRLQQCTFPYRRHDPPHGVGSPGRRPCHLRGTRFEDGAWRMELQNPALEVPKNPFVYGHTGTVGAIAGGNAPDGWRVAWDPLSFDALHWSTTYGDASLYLVDGRLTLSRGAPAHVLDYATCVARNHPLPYTHCAVDVGVDTQGDMGIIEFNSLHSSGLYAMDRTAIVRGIAQTW